MTKPWLQTFSGKRYDLTIPNPSVIRVEDVAHALSQINRYTGHTDRPYSVAQHSVMGAENSWARAHVWCEALGLYLTPRQFAAQVLLHDAHECVTGDVASPIKVAIGKAWRRFEDKHERAFRSRFGLAGAKMPAEVKVVDVRMLATEVRDRMAAPTEEWDHMIKGVEPYPSTCRRWTSTYAEARFLELAEQLGIR